MENIKTNDAGFVEFKNRNFSFAGARQTWVKVEGDQLTVSIAAKGSIGSEYLEEMKVFFGALGLADFYNELRSGDRRTVTIPTGNDEESANTIDESEESIGSNDELLTEIAELWLENHRHEHEGGLQEKEFFAELREIFDVNRDHIGDCFNDTMLYAQENGLDQHKLEERIVDLVYK